MSGGNGQNLHSRNLTTLENSRVPQNGEEVDENELKFEVCENPANEDEDSIIIKSKEQNNQYPPKKNNDQSKDAMKNCYRYGFNKVEICVKPLVLL
ncbi:Oidioi.mRNA.OKI2018_I69.chr2.g5661.t1.cds [Oikopleura dioica]|uniref:Oidioi.mRNA.OKI2018_I69.chr2.g5661.t1.cds n=1 Tax=Oikopleura dioica TaxID=34765 RepID=A0ABN7T486_OIKDI|nr:Oidioi.mRNA.OKI2018_I69.chr2.g5661.t1.cds [Oikopleura dioica]